MYWCLQWSNKSDRKQTSTNNIEKKINITAVNHKSKNHNEPKIPHRFFVLFISRPIPTIMIIFCFARLENREYLFSDWFYIVVVKKYTLILFHFLAWEQQKQKKCIANTLHHILQFGHSIFFFVLILLMSQFEWYFVVTK